VGARGPTLSRYADGMAAPSLVSTVPVIAAERLVALADATVVDLRAPAEFREDHVPGAIGVPLFDDTQRAIVGTLYARSSPQAAFDEARSIVREHIAGLLATIEDGTGRSFGREGLEALVESMTSGGIDALEAELVAGRVDDPGERPLVLSCWRGGLRSKSVVALLRALGCDDVYGLEGGYRAYRAHVRAELAAWEAPPSFVLRGLTGVGKTLVLRELERLRPGWTIDLEGLARHRSSLLGMVGLEPVSQKAFESGLAARLRRGFPGPVVFEGESRKVGDVVVPERVWSALDRGTNILLEADVPRRVEVLAEDYLAKPEAGERLRAQLARIERLMGPVKYEDVLTGLWDRGAIAELVELLLERYYDPRYRHGEKGRDYALTIDATDPARAAREVAAWIENR